MCLNATLQKECFHFIIKRQYRDGIPLQLLNIDFFSFAECAQTSESMTNTTMMPRVLSPTMTGSLPLPLTCATDAQLQATTTYTNSYSAYSPYATDSYMSAAKQRPTPYSRNMDYPTYHPRVNGIYPRSNLGYGYEAR